MSQEDKPMGGEIELKISKSNSEHRIDTDLVRRSPLPVVSANRSPTDTTGGSSPLNGIEVKKAEEKTLLNNNSHVEYNKPKINKSPEDEKGIKYHLLNPEETAKYFDVKVDFERPAKSFGLTSAEAAQRLARDGPNILTTKKQKSEIEKYMHHYFDPFNLLLNAAGILSVIAYSLDTAVPTNLYLGCVLFFITFLSSTFAYIQEGKATSVMDSFKNLLPRNAHVMREGKEELLPASQLVAGDVVRVGIGDQVPADMRMLWVADLKVENSSLTGEAIPVPTTVNPESEEEHEAHNVVFSSSLCMEGAGVGIVIRTGDRTVLGRIANMAASTTEEETTLQREIKYFVKRLTIFALIQAAIFLIIGLSRQQPWIYVLINGVIVVTVANVPQGLPLTVVSCLTIVARRLSKKKIFVKKLQGVETLGSTTVICTDKTGTLTQNRMTASHIWTDGLTMNAWMDVNTQTSTTFESIQRVAGVCNRARFSDERQLSEDEVDMLTRFEQLKNSRSISLASLNHAKIRFQDDSKRTVVGDASDTALFQFCNSRRSVELLRARYPSVFEQPFNSKNKYAITITKIRHMPNQRLLMMKGAPEIILSRCSHYYLTGRAVPIDEKFKSQFQLAYESFANEGERVLGLAELMLDPDQYTPDKDGTYAAEKGNFPTDGLVFVGLVSLTDPPKPTVKPAVDNCRSAGIKVVMVTGDHPYTAAAIARQVGIITGPTRAEIAHVQNIPENMVDENDVVAVVVKGSDTIEWKQNDWDYVLSKREIVFARTTPQQKLQIVENCQRLGNVVAVTGDGVNDAPALKKADIGVAMGLAGSDVAKDAADVILMDDDFASIVVGVQEGRVIFDNLRKTVAYTLTHLWPEVFPVLLNLALGLPLALSGIMILMIDCGTEMGPSVSLAYEDSEDDVMERPPRNANTDRLVSYKLLSYAYLQAGLVETGIALLAYFLVFRDYGISASDMLYSDDYFVAGASNLVINGRTYTESEQISIAAQAMTAYWMTVVVSQLFHIYICRTRKSSMFSHNFQNLILHFGVVISICIMVIVIYVPWAHTILGSEDFRPVFWLIPLISGGILIVWNEFYKWMQRAHRKSKFSRLIGW